MVVYADVVAILNFLVDLLLLLGTNHLTGHPLGLSRAVLGAGLGGVYAGTCLLPGCRFLGNALWRMVFLCLMGGIAFGWHRDLPRRLGMFVLLSMALGGLALGIGQGNVITMLACAGGLFLVCRTGILGAIGKKKYVSVFLRVGQKKRTVTALRDTGNLLRDPVTGQQVLVVGQGVAWELLGLTPQQLRDPIGTLATGNYTGLRLIPYRCVGQPAGMLLAGKMDEIRIDGREEAQLVAFAPEAVGGNGFEALIGGVS